MRYRETTLFSQAVNAVYQTRSNCSAFTNTTYPFTNTGTKQIWDCVVPNYHTILKRGGVLPYLPVDIVTATDVSVPNQYTSTRVTGSFRCIWSQGSWHPAESYFTLSPLPSIDSGAVSQVVNSALASAKSEAFDALTFAAELGKTAGMVSKRVGQIFDIASIVARRSSRERNPRRQKERFQDMWLEYRYGWRPLVYDISNITRQLEKMPHLKNIGKSSATQDLGYSSSKVTTGVRQLYTGTVVRTGTRTYRGFALALGKFGSTPEFRPFQTAWELVPFSFVVDWLFDVGSFISAVSPIPGISTPASGYSIRESWEESRSMDVTHNPSDVDFTITGNVTGVRTITRESYTRYPSGAVTPSFYSKLDTLKIVDIGALILQRVLPLRRFL